MTFEVWVNGKRAAESGRMAGGDAPKRIDANLRGAKRMTLLVGDADDGIDFDHADWAGAVIVLAPGEAAKPQSVSLLEGAATVPAIIHSDSPQPAIHGPRIVGSTPGHAFNFLVPATGEKPLIFAASNLPEGLVLDAETGIITGSLKQPGETKVELEVKNTRGTCKRGADDHRRPAQAGALRRRWAGTPGTAGPAR